MLTGMRSDFFKGNRRRCLESVSGGLIVLSAYSSLQSQSDMAHRFQQETNFWYLTGIDQPDWLVILDGSSGEEWLVKPHIDEVHETFDGSLSAEEAAVISGIKKVLSRDEAMLLLRKLAKKHSVVYTIDHPPYADRFNFSLNPSIGQNKKMLERIFDSVIDFQKNIAKLRAIKQRNEITAIKRAVAITVEGFNSVKSRLQLAKHEYELEAEFSYVFKKKGGWDHAYTPIIASGKNACTLHYNTNAGLLRNRQLVLMDVGARVDGYAADITRTYVKGNPTKRQLAVHSAVEAAHVDIIQLLKPGLPVEEYAKSVDRRMKQALLEVGLLQSVDDDDTYRKYFPHAISHGLGIDVHDSLGGTRVLEPGMVLTVEPGIYIPDEGIGIRIEDDILITDTGHNNLSSKLPTAIA